MKKILFSGFIAALFAYGCSDSNANGRLPRSADAIEKDTASFTQIQWLDSSKDFGTAKYGDKVNINYTFKNTGAKPLYLLSVQPTCGCTIADYTQSAVMPGKEGYVKAVYDSHHGVPGAIHKSIIVTSNTKNDAHFVLAFSGEVVK